MTGGGVYMGPATAMPVRATKARRRDVDFIMY
jgi:hypothetical protein